MQYGYMIGRYTDDREMIDRQVDRYIDRYIDR